ncbi:DUF732 domain-containing protein [Yinghuangia sp. YIM S09857]|uniref:DUF732 domain-containing protein n=1 Tax=Yinghuangia sp. YIM S09857 TaxID=3436929 RepID=UPI003F53A6ED
MRRIHLGIAAAATALLLAGCGSDDSDTADTAGNSTPTTAAASPPAPPPSDLPPEQRASIQAAAGIPPAPDAATQAAYAADLNKINPKIVDGKTERAVDRGRNVCSDLANGKDHAKVIENLQYRFGSGALTISDTEAEKILTAITTHICP